MVSRYSLQLLFAILLIFVATKVFARTDAVARDEAIKEICGPPWQACMKKCHDPLKSAKYSKDELSKCDNACSDEFDKCYVEHWSPESNGAPKNVKNGGQESTPKQNSGMQQNGKGVWTN